MLNQEQIKGKWTEIKGGVRNLWGQITDDELEQTKGNLSAIAGIIEQRYGETKEVVKEKLDTLMDSFDNETDKHPDDIGASSYQRNPTGVRTSPAADEEYDTKEIFDDELHTRPDKSEDRIARH